MKNEASKTRSLDIAFVVDAELLKRLAEILGETSDTLEYTVKFSDGTSVRYADMQEITGQPNSNQRSIVSLIAGTAGEKSKSAFVNLKKDDSPSLEYTVFGTQRDVIYFANQLDDWVAATRQWYSRFLSSEKTMSGGGALLFIAVIALPIWIRPPDSLFPRSWKQRGIRMARAASPCVDGLLGISHPSALSARYVCNRPRCEATPSLRLCS